MERGMNHRAILVLVLTVSLLWQVAEARRIRKPTPVRIQYSGNLEGNLSPCG
jgi:hypothetical protein